MSNKSFGKSESGDKLKISDVKKQTEILKNTLIEHTSKLLVERGDELKNLKNKTDTLSKHSLDFTKCTSDIKRKQKRYKIKQTMVLFVLLLIFLLFIIGLFVILILTKPI